jgi:hypothetical protein
MSEPTEAAVDDALDILDRLARWCRQWDVKFADAARYERAAETLRQLWLPERMRRMGRLGAEARWNRQEDDA